MGRFWSPSTRRVFQRIVVDWWIWPVQNQSTEWCMECFSMLGSIGPVNYTIKPLKTSLPNEAWTASFQIHMLQKREGRLRWKKRGNMDLHICKEWIMNKACMKLYIRLNRCTYLVPELSGRAPSWRNRADGRGTKASAWWSYTWSCSSPGTERGHPTQQSWRRLETSLS
jgi:hypothetical protein